MNVGEIGWAARDLEDLINEISPQLLAYLTRMTQPVDDAADILAETLLTVWKRRSSLPTTRDQARAWIYVTARNHLANHRRGHVRRTALADRLREQLAGYDDGVYDNDRAQQVRDALACLPDEDQEIITLINWDGFGVAEAGVVMGLSPSTARSRYARAKARLVRALATEEGYR